MDVGGPEPGKVAFLSALLDVTRVVLASRLWVGVWDVLCPKRGVVESNDQGVSPKEEVRI